MRAMAAAILLLAACGGPDVECRSDVAPYNGDLRPTYRAGTELGMSDGNVYRVLVDAPGAFHSAPQDYALVGPLCH